MSARVEDLRSICIHEAAHAAVARHYGYTTHWRVTPVPDMRHGANSDADWHGCTWFHGPGKGVSADRRIGLAGVVAQILTNNPDVCAYAVDDFIHLGAVEMSESDWDLVGAYRIRDVQDTMRLVRRMLPGIQWEAEQVVREHVGGGQ